jgi:hypothetical protein
MLRRNIIRDQHTGRTGDMQETAALKFNRSAVLPGSPVF